MKTKQWQLLVLFVVLALLASGCGVTIITVPVTKPAEINLKGYEKIAVAEISGSGGQDMQEELTTALFGSGRFEVLDRQYLGNILSEQGLTWSGISDPEESAKLGKVLGAAALVCGRVITHNYKEEPIRYSTHTRKDGTTYTWYYRDGTAKMAVNLKVIDVQSGKILATKRFKSEYRGSTSEQDAEPDEIDTTALFASCRNDIISQFMRTIAPYTIMVNMSFTKDKEIPDLEQGINMAKVGNWDSAIEYFQGAVDNFPSSWKAHFDLGLAYECTGEYEKAIEELNTAYSLNPKSSIANEISQCKMRIAEQKKLEEQL